MTAAVVTGRTNRLTLEEQEELHLRIATAASLNDPNINPERIVHDILSRHEENVPLYPGPKGSINETDQIIQQKIASNDHALWDSIFSIIEKGQIDALDHFVQLGFKINSPHPYRQQYPIFAAVRASQTNMMRHLINNHAEVDCWSAIPPTSMFQKPDMERSRTPLMAAAEQGNLNICKILCETAFADPMLVAPDGQTAQRLAARNGYKEIVLYLPANRGGVLKRLKYDYRHRWTFIRKGCHGIYVFFRVLLWELPKVLLYHLPKYLGESIGRSFVELYRGIPPVKEWPGICRRAIISVAEGIRDFFIALGKGIKATPKAIYDFGKWAGKSLWRGIKAIPGLASHAARKTWEGLKIMGNWIANLLLNIISFAHTVLSAIVNFFRSITLADILNGLKTIFRGIFIDLPQLLWSALKALGRGIEKTLIAFFGYLYWIVYYIIYGLIWVVMFVPKRLGEILGSIAGGIAKAFRELWIWISPKSMA